MRLINFEIIFHTSKDGGRVERKKERKRNGLTKERQTEKEKNGKKKT